MTIQQPMSTNADQAPAEVAVVIPTILRPSLLRAVRSVFCQNFSGRIHLLIGIDVPLGDPAIIDTLRDECPPHIMLTILDLGYSTSRRHGGLYSNFYGGALRTILSHAANAPLVAYLDDNDWFAGDHLATLCQAIAGKQWAFSYRWIVDPATLWPICRDEWDSVGPGQGINAANFGGFVQPSTLMIDKTVCHRMLHLWSMAAFPDGSGEDRLVFDELSENYAGAASGRFTTYCTASAEAVLHDHHTREFERRNIGWVTDRTLVPELEAHAAEALAAHRDGRWDEARRACEAVLRINPYHAPTLHLLAESEWRLGAVPEALASLDRAIEVDDLEPRYFDTQASILLASGKALQAMQVMAAARRRFPPSMLPDGS
ncbi:tetratricopeptide repeat protein [Azospirillum sp. sgz301742]